MRERAGDTAPPFDAGADGARNPGEPVIGARSGEAGTGGGQAAGEPAVAARVGGAEGGGADRVAYDFAVLRVVPNVATGACANVGVILHARTAEFLGARMLHDPATLRRLAPTLDTDLLARYLAACEAIARGEASAGPVALTSTSERFHWLTAPRSDVLQCSPVHEGVCDDPAWALESLFEQYVARVWGSGAAAEDREA